MTNSKFFIAWNALLSKITSSQSKYKKIVTFAAAAFLLIFVGVYKIGSFQQEKKLNPISFKTSFDKWVSQTKIDQNALQYLTTQLKQLPELKTLYQGKIIQHCLNLGDMRAAQSLLKESSFFNSPKDSVYFHRFSEISLIICSKEYSRAYEESLLLKEDLLADRAFWNQQKYGTYGADLYMYNLVRIAFLSKYLGKKELELTAWAEVNKYLETDTSFDSSQFLEKNFSKKILVSFSEEGVSLKDYIKYRESSLKKAL
jgi:hypothetical protein